MKKGILLALAVSISAFSFAQKKELKTAAKAIKSNNFAEAKGALSNAKSLMSQMDEDLKSKYYYLNAMALYANGKGSEADIDAALENLDKVKTGYKTEAADLKQKIVNSFITDGNKAYEAQNFSKASKYFEKSYRYSNQKDTLFLYYAAATAVNDQEYDRALTLYEELKDLGFTGIKKEYYATNVETGEEEILDKRTRDLYVKAKSHIKPGERMTKSRLPEIVKNIAFIYINKGDDEKALEAIKDAREKNPEDINLILSAANIYFKMGNTEEFKALLEKATEMDPQNPELQYNLGVISYQSKQYDKAREYYDKAIALDPNYINAYINIAALVLEKEKPIIEEMNGLGTSAADDRRYDELRQQRQDLYKEAVPFLSKALEINPKNLDAAKTLMNIYSVLGETAKRDELKQKIADIEAGN